MLLLTREGCVFVGHLENPRTGSANAYSNPTTSPASRKASLPVSMAHSTRRKSSTYTGVKGMIDSVCE